MILNVFKIFFFIIILILSIIMYFKGIRKIKQNNYSSLLFSIFPSLMTKILFIHKNSGDYDSFYKKHKKQLDIELENYDEKVKNDNKIQMLFYTFCYIILWCWIIYLIFLVLSNFYETFFDISTFLLKICKFISLVMIILIFCVIWRKDR